MNAAYRRAACGLALGLAGLGVRATRAAADEPAPKIAFDREEHDFGVAPQEKELQTEFTVRNDGDAPLRELKAVADCGCYGTTLSASELAPGASATLKVSFRTLMLVGPVRKRLTVHSNDPKRPMVTIHLKLLVGAGVVVDPGRLHFDNVLVGSMPSGSVFAKWLEGVGKPFQVLAVEVPGHKDDVRVTTEAHEERKAIDSDKDGKPIEGTWKGTKVTFTFTKPPPIGTFSATALLRTDHPDFPRITVPLTAAVSGKVWISYRTIYFGWVKAGETKRNTMVVRPFSADVKLGEVTAVARNGKVKVELARDEKSPSPLWKLTVVVPPDAAVGTLDDVVELRTEVPGEERTEITVHGEVLPAAH